MYSDAFDWPCDTTTSSTPKALHKNTPPWNSFPLPFDHDWNNDHDNDYSPSSSSSWKMDIISPFVDPGNRTDQSHPILLRHPPLREKTKRPQLSCNPCRQRKVKCDRIQPCTACSMHQIADQCQYDLSEAERQPILQAEALKEKDKAIARLRNEVEVLRGHPIKSEPADEAPSTRGPQKMKLPPKVAMKPPSLAQRRLQSNATIESMCFGGPGMTNVIDEFADLAVDRKALSLAQSVPRMTEVLGVQMTAPHPLGSPKDETTCLVKLLPSREDIHFYLHAFQRRSHFCSFPHVPEECTEPEVQRFLEDVEHNAAAHPNTLALLFATLAQGLQDGIYDRNGEKWIAGAVESELMKGDVYIAAAMQALRIASFMNRPTLLTIQTLVMMGPYLTNSGKFLDASALFGLTVRLAQSVGLHRDPHQMDPPLSLKDITIRKSIWWWMLQMDQHYSMALGRPLAMSSIGECAAPEPIMPDPVLESLANYITQFTSLGREILSTGYMGNDQIDRFTDDLLLLKQTLPSLLQFDETWLNQDNLIPGWPLDAQAGILHAKTHNLLILLNQKRTDSLSHNSQSSSAELLRHLSASGVSYRPRGRAQVLVSCRALLAAFEFFKTRVRASMISWTMGQMAFNAAMILTLSMLETKDTTDLTAVQLTYSTFIEMNKLGIHKLAGAAVEKLGSLLKDFDSGDMMKEKFMGQQGMLLLEDLDSQWLSSGSVSPLNFTIGECSVRSDKNGKRRNAAGAEFRSSMIGTGKSALAQRRRAPRTPHPGRDGRSRIPSKKPSANAPRSPFHRPRSRERSPKKPKQERLIIDPAHDFSSLPQTASYDFLSPTNSEPAAHNGLYTSEQVYQTFQSADFDGLNHSPRRPTFDSMAHSQTTGDFLSNSRPPPFVPQNTPTEPHMHSLHHQDSQMISAGLLELSHFQPTAEQQQLLNFNLNSQGYIQNPQYGNTHFEMTQIPVTYSPSFQ